jgi:DNA-binding MarR family transcriptional regulator
MIPSPSRESLIETLSELTLPVMWTMRQDAMRAFEPLHIRPIKALLLGLIAKGLQHPKNLADIMDTQPPAISSMLAELEDAGYIERNIDPKDRRRIQLKLSPEGDKLMLELGKAWHQTSLDRAEKLSNEELQTMIYAFQKMMDAA